jgi:hypothetical protein
LHAFERAVDPELLRVEGRNLLEWTIKIVEACVYKPWKRESKKSCNNSGSILPYIIGNNQL